MKRVLSVLVLVALAIAPAAVFAQTEEPETMTFTSADGLLTLQAPAEWDSEELPAETGLPGVQLASSPETLDRLINGGALESGEQGVVVMLIPTDLMELIGIPVAQDGTASDLASAFAYSFTGVEPGAAEATAEPGMMATEDPFASNTNVSAVQTEELSSGVEAASVTYADSLSEGSIVAYELKDGLAVVIISIVVPDEYTDAFHQQIIDLASTIQYAGEPEDLVAALMGSMGVEPTSPDMSTAEPDAMMPAATEAVAG
ncbi:MAG TPA: hypothetical protein PKD09_19550 [Aggregatilinea sp.]|uniref:hypothetical protein n=1 Tax=Aggregatilinea sp. TaxID=2806333 RepID=UPI002BE4095B|nr:hypothetical protein [Aggregatilinea sp.]HML23860.1 hypothetical protein [Aggregatilinea sp.]